MLRINRDDQSLHPLEAPTLADVSLTERYDLQAFIAKSADAFFAELGQQLFLVGEEIVPSTNVADRIDLLAIDKEGAAVVIELKRGNHKLQMLQAISYAGMISHWEADDFLGRLDDVGQERLADFLDVDAEAINRSQRIILIAEAYDYALLTGAEWLSEQFDVDIMCCRVSMAKDPTTGAEYLASSVVYPAPELTQEAIPRGRKATQRKIKWDNWEAALAAIPNRAIADYMRREIAANRESYLRKRVIWYRLANKRRWFVAARNSSAYVWQNGRFDRDIEFWRERLGDREGVKPVKDGACLRMFLTTKEDCDRLHRAATEELGSVQWLQGVAEDDEEIE